VYILFISYVISQSIYILNQGVDILNQVYI
jgi:hypothetical protein